ncbi:MAG: PrsW family glutamic-type intramembrane protease [Chloroflexota bacterium]
MARYSGPRILTPPREEEEVYPYRRVWPSLILEVSSIFGVTLILYVMVGFLGFNLPESLWQPAGIVIALSPAVFWLLFERLPEQRVQQPRRQLTGVFVISMLVANAVGIPLLDSLNIEEWLTLEATFDRILGYAATLGILQETLKYLVLRFLVWPDALRTRTDALAYAVAAAAGYATIVNLHVVFTQVSAPSPDVTALRVFSTTMLHFSASAVTAFGLAQLRFNARSIALPLSMLAASLLAGFAITFRSGLVSGGFALGIAGTRPLFGLVFSLILIVAVLISIAFLFNAAERQSREALASTEEA